MNPANKKPSGHHYEASHHRDDYSESEASNGSCSLLSHKSESSHNRSASANNYHTTLSDSDSDATTDDYPGRNMSRKKKATVATKKPAAK